MMVFMLLINRFNHKYKRKSNYIKYPILLHKSCIIHFINRVIGHSLGGALATHAVAHLITIGYKISLFETYGCPRVGDK